MYAYLLTTALLFFVLTPGILLRLPPGGSQMVVAATHARYRIDQAVRFYAGLLAVSFAALVLAVWGY